jgi:hypothetical protein
MFKKTVGTIKSIRKILHILPALLAVGTQKPRYIPIIEWSKKSWTHNIFRFYELIFGRRLGIRAELSSVPFDGKVYYFCHSWESVFAVFETRVRELLAKTAPKFSRIYIPAIQTNYGMPQVHFPYLFAIAYDAVSSQDGGVAVTNTYTHTCTGSNLTLTTVASLAQSPTPTATATYNSTPMTEGVLNTLVTNVPGYIFYLPSPSTGANSVVVTASASARNFGGSISMSGTASSPSGATNTASGSSTTPSISVTTTQDNSWLVNSVWGNNTVAALSPTTTGGSQTSRYTLDHVAGGTMSSASTQTTTSTGSYTSSWSFSVSTSWSSTILEIKELASAGGSTQQYPTLLLLNVG